MKWILSSLFAVALILSVTSADAQCRRFTEKTCLPELAPYSNNGQISTTTLFEGDSATMVMTFYSLLDYRLMVCPHPVLGQQVHFKVRDNDGELLYNSKEGEKNVWDFRVNSTQDLRIDVIVPEDPESASNMPPSGCVSIVLGFKE